MVEKKYHFSDYYSRFRICKGCGEYVPIEDVCPACGKMEMVTKIAERYSYSNPRKCGNCSYESFAFSVCPKCGTEMKLIRPYLIGDFTSLGDHYPDVIDCSEDEEILEVAETELCFNAFSNKTKRINVICNYYDWHVQKCPKCISISKDWMGDFFNMEISPNLDKRERTVRIEIRCREKRKEIVILQKGAAINQIRSLRDLWTFLKSICKTHK